MTTPNKIIERLEALRCGLVAARDFQHSPEIRAVVPQYLEGQSNGLNIAIQAIDTEIRMIRAGEQAERKLMQSTTNNKE